MPDKLIDLLINLGYTCFAMLCEKFRLWQDPAKHVQLRFLLAIESPQLIRRIGIKLGCNDDKVIELARKGLNRFLIIVTNDSLLMDEKRVELFRGKLINGVIKAIHKFKVIVPDKRKREYPKLLAKLDSFLLFDAYAPDTVKRQQNEQILDVIWQKLIDYYDVSYIAIESLLKQDILPLTRQNPACFINYRFATTNILNLLLRKNPNLEGIDMSDLNVGAVNFDRVNLKNANLKNTDLKDAVFSERFDSVSASAFHPDGHLFVTGGRCDGELIVWDIQTRRSIYREIRHPLVTIWQILFFNDDTGYYIASCGADGYLKVSKFNQNYAASCKLETVCSYKTDAFLSCIARFGDIIVAAGGDGKVFSCDFKKRTWNCIHTAESGVEYHSIAFSPNGYFLVAGRNDGRCDLFAEKEYCKTFDICENSNIYSIAFLTQREFLIGNEFGNIIKLRIEDNEKISMSIFHAHSEKVTQVLAIDHNKFLTRGFDKFVKLYDGNEFKTLIEYHEEIITICNNGDYILYCCMDNLLCLYNLRAGKVVFSLKGLSVWINRLAFIKNDDYLVSVCADGTSRVWNLSDNSKKRVYKNHHTEVIGMSTDDKHLISGARDGRVVLLNLDDESSTVILLDGIDRIRNITLFNNSIIVAANTKMVKSLKIIEDSGIRTSIVSSDFLDWLGDVATLRFSNNEFLLAYTANDYTIKLCDNSLSIVGSLDIPMPTRIQTLASSPNWFIAAGDGLNFFVWEMPSDHIGSWSPPKTLEIKNWGEGGKHIGSVAFSPTIPSLVVLVGGDGAVRLYDLEEEKTIFVERCSSHSLHTVAFSKDGNRVATGGAEGKVFVYNVGYDGNTKKPKLCKSRVIEYDLYQGMNVRNAEGLTDSQKIGLKELGAIE